MKDCCRSTDEVADPVFEGFVGALKPFQKKFLRCETLWPLMRCYARSTRKLLSTCEVRIKALLLFIDGGVDRLCETMSMLAVPWLNVHERRLLSETCWFKEVPRKWRKL